MTLSFDILAGNNANWGFDAFSLLPEPATGPLSGMEDPYQQQQQPQASPERIFMTAPQTAAAAPQRTMSGSLQNISGPHVAAVENEENISPMKNDALCVTLLASDPAARAFDSNLYVASLPDWFTDADLYELFKRFGPILSAKVMCHKGTHHCKGYGFVLFQRTDDAAAARSEMIGHVVGGNKIQVRRARSAASAPLSDAAPPAAQTFVEAPRHAPQSPANNASLNVSPHLVSNAPQPFHTLYSAAPTYVVTGAGSGAMSGTSTAGGQTMLVAIPNGRGAVQGPDGVVYMVLTPSQLQSTNVIF